MGMAYTSPVDHTAEDGLLESNTGTSDTKGELISPEQVKFTDATSEAVSEELAPWMSILVKRLSDRPHTGV